MATDIMPLGLLKRGYDNDYEIRGTTVLLEDGGGDTLGRDRVLAAGDHLDGSVVVSLRTAVQGHGTEQGHSPCCWG